MWELSYPTPATPALRRAPGPAPRRAREGTVGLGPGKKQPPGQPSRDITLTTGLVDTFSIRTLLRLMVAGQVDAQRFVTHRFALDDMMAAYDVFSRAADTGTLKVGLSRDA
jgi:threonine dehydrogenase-like Zn-dependent dehydrogenase